MDAYVSIDCDYRFKSNNLTYLQLPHDGNGFIKLKCQIIDDILCYKNKKIFDMNELEKYAKIRHVIENDNNDSDSESDIEISEDEFKKSFENDSKYCQFKKNYEDETNDPKYAEFIEYKTVYYKSKKNNMIHLRNANMSKNAPPEYVKLPFQKKYKYYWIYISDSDAENVSHDIPLWIKDKMTFNNISITNFHFCMYVYDNI